MTTNTAAEQKADATGNEAKSGKKDESRKRTRKSSPDPAATPVVNNAAAINSEERFQRLFQQLAMRPTLEEPLVIGITSTRRGEGRSLVALGLAQAITLQLPQPVVLLEADLEQPCLAQDLKLNARGLSEFLRGEIVLDDLLQRLPSGDMQIIAAGDCAGQSLATLRSSNLEVLMGSLRLQAAAIVIDLPPLSATGQAARVIDLLDHVLMVVEAGVTPAKSVKQALELIPDDKRLGVLLNRTRSVFGVPEWIRKVSPFR